MQKISPRKLLITNLMMLTVSVLWGVAWPVGRILATDLLELPFTIMFLRYTFALPVLFVWMWYREGYTVPKQSDWSPLTLMAVTSVFLYQIGYMYGMQRTAASDASLVIGFNPIFVAILSVFVLSHKFSSKGLFGIFLSFLGILMVFFASPNVSIPLEERLIGNSLIMFGAFSYAIYNVMMRRYFLVNDEKALSSLSLIADKFIDSHDIIGKVFSNLNHDLPSQLKQGNIIRKGVNKESAFFNLSSKGKSESPASFITDRISFSE